MEGENDVISRLRTILAVAMGTRLQGTIAGTGRAELAMGEIAVVAADALRVELVAKGDHVPDDLRSQVHHNALDDRIAAVVYEHLLHVGICDKSPRGCIDAILTALGAKR